MVSISTLVPPSGPFCMIDEFVIPCLKKPVHSIRNIYSSIFGVAPSPPLSFTYDFIVRSKNFFTQGLLAVNTSYQCTTQRLFN